MRLMGLLVQSVVYVFIVNISLSAYSLVMTFSLAQTAAFVTLSLVLSIVMSVVFRKMNRFARTFLAAACVSIAVNYYFSFIFSIEVPFLEVFTVLFASYLVSVIVTRLFIGNRYDDTDEEMTAAA